MLTTEQLDAIKRAAEWETDGMVASSGRDCETPDAQPHIVTYYTDIPPALAFKPAACIERGDVLALIAEVTRLRPVLAAAETEVEAMRAALRHGIIERSRNDPIHHQWGARDFDAAFARLEAAVREAKEEEDHATDA